MVSLSEHAFPTSSSQSWLAHPPLEPSRASAFPQTLVAGLLSIFVFALPTDLHPLGGISVTLPVGSLCIVLGVLGIMKSRTTVVPTFGVWCLLAFVVWSTFSLAWAEYPDTTMQKLIKYWEYLPMTWVITQYVWDRRIRIRLFDAYLAGCWLGVLGTLFNYAIGNEFYIPGADAIEQEKRYSFSTDVNYLALALVIGVIIALYRIYSDRTWWKQILFLLYIPAAFLAIALTGSRGALLALVGAIVTFAIVTDMRKRIAIIVGTIALLTLISVLPPSVTWRLSTTSNEISHGDLDGRAGLWQHGMILVEEHPLVGVGVGGTFGALDYAAHNTPLELLIEGGVVSLVLFYVGVSYSVYCVWKIAGQEGTALVVICAAWLVGTLSISWDANPNTWFIFAMLLSAGRAQRAVRVSSGVRRAHNVVRSAQ